MFQYRSLGNKHTALDTSEIRIKPLARFAVMVQKKTPRLTQDGRVATAPAQPLTAISTVVAFAQTFFTVRGGSSGKGETSREKPSRITSNMSTKTTGIKLFSLEGEEE
jgi:hypothetical protein